MCAEVQAAQYCGTNPRAAGAGGRWRSVAGVRAVSGSVQALEQAGEARLEPALKRVGAE